MSNRKTMLMRLVRRFSLPIALVVLGNSGISYAADWSFEDHPHPLFEALTPQELDEIQNVAEKPEDFYCQNANQAQFEIYLKRYPDYLESGGARSGLQENWKSHVYSTPNAIDLMCLVKYEAKSLARDIFAFWSGDPNDPYSLDHDLLYCGKFVRRDRSAASLELAMRIEKFQYYVGLNEPRWAHEYLAAFESSAPTAILHPDVEYYFQKRFVFESWQQTVHAPKTHHPTHEFTPERLAFLNDAVARGDFQLVIDTMGDCMLP